MNVSQTGVTFHGICPPTFIQTWLQQYGRGAFLYSAHCSFSNHICFWSVWYWRAMVPGKIFTVFAKFQGIVSVKDFKFPLWLHELLQAPFGFLWSFCFARIRLDPLGGQVLHHDSNRWLFRHSQLSLGTLWSAVIKSPKFSARGTAPPMRLLHGTLVNFGPLTDLAISVFMKMSLNTVFTQILTSRKRSKDGSWEELACESLCSGTLSSTRCSLNSCSHSGMSEFNKFPVLDRGLRFYLVLDYWLAWSNRSPRSCLSTCLLDTDTG